MGKTVRVMVNLVVALFFSSQLFSCANVDYIAREEIDDNPKYSMYKSEIYKTKQVGALRFSSAKKPVKNSLAFAEDDKDLLKSDSTNLNDIRQNDVSNFANSEDENILILQRKGARYYGETMFYQSEDKKYFFSFGVDGSIAGADVGLRVEF